MLGIFSAIVGAVSHSIGVKALKRDV
jgi:hypothetical protein